MSQKPIANMYDAPSRVFEKGSNFKAHLTRVGALAGAKDLGATYTVVPAGKSAFPRHSHYNNEELIIILEGEGTYKQGDESWSVKPGDTISALAGGGDSAHQLTNSSDADLKYLAISTRNDPDICIYPDSDKFLVAAGIPEEGGAAAADFKLIGRERPMLDYWDGEDVGDES